MRRAVPPLGPGVRLLGEGSAWEVLLDKGCWGARLQDVAVLDLGTLGWGRGARLGFAP